MQVVSQDEDKGRYSGEANLVDCHMYKKNQQMFGKRMYWNIWSQEIWSMKQQKNFWQRQEKNLKEKTRKQ